MSNDVKYSFLVMNTSISKIQNIIRIIVLLVGQILLIEAINIIRIFNIERLSSKETMNVAFDLFAMIVLTIVYVSCAYGSRNRTSESFNLLLMSVYLCVFCELGSWMVDLVSSARIYNYLFNIGSSSMTIISSVLFFYFTCKSLSIELKTIKTVAISVLCVAIVGIIAELLNIMYGYYYYIDMYGAYVRNSKGSYWGYLPYVYILGITGILIIKKQMPARKKGIYMTYILVPFVVSAWYMFTALPPTFFVATFISVILIYANIYVDLGQEKVKYELENAHKETELALQRNKQTLSQIRPHFIFNALGSIEELCVVDAKKAESAVHYFAKYLRANMDALGEADMVPFDEELEHIRNYIWLEKMRFDDELEFIEDIKADNFMVPTLSLQPLIENAVKHGMMGKEEGALHVELRAYEKDSDYVIEIIDDGCGFDVSQKKDDGRSHVGMSYARTSIENRLGGSIAINSEIGKGTKISINIPQCG